MPGIVEQYVNGRVSDRELELEEAMNRRIHQAMESYGPEGREAPGAWRRAEREASQEIAALTAFREKALNDLARLHLHPEEARQNDWQLYGALTYAEGRIEALEDQRERLLPQESRSLASDLEQYANRTWGMDHPEPASAEEAMARKMAYAIGQGWGSMDLSLEYATDSPAQAEERHGKALAHLHPFIERAEALGFKVDRGEAGTYDIHRNFEESEGFSQGVS